MAASRTLRSAAHAQSALRFQFLEKRHYRWRIDLLEVQLRGFPVKTQLGEARKLAKRIPLETDGLRARLALLHQVPGEELFQKGNQADSVGHARSSRRPLRQRMALRINSGDHFR